MKKKLVLSLAAAAMVGTLAVGGTLAWFTDTETAVNVVTTGNVDIAWVENGNKITDKNKGVEFGKDTPIVPNAKLEKEAYVDNEGKNDALIRVKADIAREIVEYVTVGYNGESEKWLDGEDGWFYYADVVKAGSKTDDFIKSLTIPAEVGNAVADIENAKVELQAEAIQADEISDDIKAVGNTVDVLKTVFNGKTIESFDTETAQ